MPMYEEVIVQMNINIELKDLSSTQSWLHALIKVYKTILQHWNQWEHYQQLQGMQVQPLKAKLTVSSLQKVIY